MKNFLPFALALSLLLGAFSCRSDDADLDLDKEALEANVRTWQYMHEWYLWNDGIPDIDPAHYETPKQVLREMAWFNYDRWSTVGDLALHSSFYEAGQYVGFGYGLEEDENGDLRLSFVYDDSPFGDIGAQRGYQVMAIDGTPYTEISSLSETIGPALEGSTTTFTLKNLEGEIEEYTLSQRVCTINPVLHTEVREVAGKQVGYIVFKTFIEPSFTALEEAFALVESSGVDELVLDLRYNRGGRVDVAVDLCERIVPASAVGSDLIRYVHNADRAEENDRTTVISEKPNDLGLERLIVLSSRRTASASELVINCLRPYMPVVLIGNKTYGKPVGSYGFTYENYVISPIAFAVNNANDEGGYFDAIQPNNWTEENFSVPFGDEEEWGWKQARYFVETGAFDETIGKSGFQGSEPIQDWNPQDLRWEVGSW